MRRTSSTGEASAPARAAAETVYVASGQNWPDALAGGAKAGSDHEPLLITRQDGLPSAIVAAIERLYPERVVVIGGTTAVSDESSMS